MLMVSSQPDVTAASRLSRRKRSRSVTSQRGFMMLSAMATLLIVSTAVVAGLLGISTASRLTAQNSLDATASGIAASQIDEVRTATFIPTPGEYASVATPANFTVQNETFNIPDGDSNIQEVKITVSHSGVAVKEVSIIKAKR